MEKKNIVTEHEEKTPAKTAIIIGAGPAGLTAAYEMLKSTDYKPIILEASAYIGGISRTALHNGNRMDIGGHRFFTKDKRILALWKEIMPDMLTRPRVSRIFYRRKFFDYPLSLKWRTIRNMGVWRTLLVGAGYVTARIFRRKEVSLEAFMINRFGTPLYKMFFKDYTAKVWGRDPSVIDASWGAQRIRGLSLKKLILTALGLNKERETSLIEEFSYPKHGPGEFYEQLADKVRELGGEIRMNSEVAGITRDAVGLTHVTLANGERVEGDYFFSSMPIKDLLAAMNDVPSEAADVAKNLPYRDFMTVGLLADKLKIKEGGKNYPPDCWIYIQEHDVKLGRLQIFNNWSPYMVEDENTVWIGLEYFCDEGDDLWEMPDDAFIDFAVDELEKIDILERGDVKDSVRLRVKKAYPAYFDSYSEFGLVREFLDKMPNLYCIGRNGQHRYNNMDHSMLTALCAVDALKNGTNAEKVWNVNTEGGYHESA
ncbi:MAG: NAD(P)/FAD-dependent oxidoreductase [Clostridiales bacterium]|nr:NAD(P)/FAD-dependent oxidoreductase [Clostridiales bacterium]